MAWLLIEWVEIGMGFVEWVEIGVGFVKWRSAWMSCVVEMGMVTAWRDWVGHGRGEWVLIVHGFQWGL